MALIEMTNVSKKYKNNVSALRGIDVEIEEGEFVYLIGHSGAGKSSFIKMLYHEEAVTRGQLYVGKYNLSKLRRREVPHLRRSVGVVFQDYKLLPRKTVFENVAYAMEVIGVKPRHIKKRVAEVLDMVGLTGKAKAFPNQLSGGEQQRVAIARAMVNMPQLLIADEPTGNLDPENAIEIMDLLEEINKEGTTIIMATHNKQLVDAYRHRVIELKDGKIVRDAKEGGYESHD